MFDIRFCGINRIDFELIYVQTQDRDTRPSELKRQWKANVAKSDYRDSTKIYIGVIWHFLNLS